MRNIDIEGWDNLNFKIDIDVVIDFVNHNSPSSNVLCKIINLFKYAAEDKKVKLYEVITQSHPRSICEIPKEYHTRNMTLNAIDVGVNNVRFLNQAFIPDDFIVDRLAKYPYEVLLFDKKWHTTELYQNLIMGYDVINVKKINFELMTKKMIIHLSHKLGIAHIPVEYLYEEMCYHAMLIRSSSIKYIPEELQSLRICELVPINLIKFIHPSNMRNLLDAKSLSLKDRIENIFAKDLSRSEQIAELKSIL